MWRNVELEDISETVFLGPRGVPPDAPEIRTGAAEGNAPAAAPQLDSLAVVASTVSLALRKYSSALYVDASLRFVSGGPGGGAGNQMFADLEKLVVDGPEGAVVLDVEKSAAQSVGQGGGGSDSAQQQQQQQHDGGGDDDDGSAPRAFALRAGSEFANYFVDYELQCVRNYQCSPSVRRALRRRQRALLAQLSRPALTFGLDAQLPETDSTFCYTLLRDDILYSEVMVEHYLPNAQPAAAFEPNALPPVSSVDGVPRKRMAFLIATLTTPDVPSAAEVSVLRRLLPSVLTTLSEEEMRRFEIVVYIGFDEGDRYWDDPSTRRELDGMMKSLMFKSGAPERQAAPLPAEKAVVHFRYVRLPFSKGWVTYVWNGLFVKAYHDGCDFFFQINDDCTFETAGWLTALTAPLSAPPADDPSAYPAGFGVAGPPDLGHAARIFTQAVVSRTHYEIFGRLYPIDIKDWYSDDWITQVYGDLGRHRAEGTVVKNWNDKGTRYNVCSKPRYEEVLSRSKQVVQKWLERWRATRDGTVAEDNAMFGVEILVQ
ncbi:MAG: hypothetical protein BJ554DRAFT_3650 [Olpidium bornovanus]|uniref:Uncharacterized protein n=1 Tax=Olpidium bornovanus TaxID=278681 RepID=A0A8H8DG37_9FUNG|nr:MAG: hypothetical protein BJ554DRAFT_3650 [Olpidium bornovanus]